MADENGQQSVPKAPSPTASPATPPSAHTNQGALHNFIHEAIEATNPSLRHLASHSSLGSQLSRNRSRGSRGDSDFRSGTTRRSVRPLSTNFEEQRHPGNSTLRISHTTKAFEPDLKEDPLPALPELRRNRPGVHRSRVGARSGSHAFGSDDITLYSEVPASRYSDKYPEFGGLDPVERPLVKPAEKAADKTVDQAETNAAAPGAEEEDDTVYPGPLGLFILITGIALSVFLISLDRTIITTVSPPFDSRT